MAIVLTYGTFDLFHIGHLRLLERLAQVGTDLYVGVSTDEFNEAKGKKTIVPFSQRSAIVGSIRCVSGVFPETSWDQKRSDIKRLGAATLGMGDDWVGKFDDLSDICKVIYLPRTEGISSTVIKQSLRVFSQSYVKELKDSVDAISAIVRAMDV